MVIFQGNQRLSEYVYQTEDEFEKDIVDNADLFFGETSIYIDIKKTIKSESLGNTIPDGYLLDLSDIENPEFYLVDVELYKHDFYSHIFPQITKFFAFFQSLSSRRELVDKIYLILNEDPFLKDKFLKPSNRSEIYKYLSDLVENSQNILLIIDEEKKELPNIVQTYTDTWGKMVKIEIIKKFTTPEQTVFAMEPEFDTVEYSLNKSVEDVTIKNTLVTENFHLENKKPFVISLYNKLKNLFLEVNPELQFNPQKYYISVVNEKNVIFYKIRKEKIRLIVMIAEEQIRSQALLHSVKSLSESVQKFYNGKCAAIDIENDQNLEEIINLVKPIIEKQIRFNEEYKEYELQKLNSNN